MLTAGSSDGGSNDDILDVASSTGAALSQGNGIFPPSATGRCGTVGGLWGLSPVFAISANTAPPRIRIWPRNEPAAMESPPPPLRNLRRCTLPTSGCLAAFWFEHWFSPSSLLHKMAAPTDFAWFPASFQTCAFFLETPFGESFVESDAPPSDEEAGHLLDAIGMLSDDDSLSPSDAEALHLIDAVMMMPHRGQLLPQTSYIGELASKKALREF
jgi:hypothetical protein